jgi:hypothetical protein
MNDELSSPRSVGLPVQAPPIDRRLVAAADGVQSGVEACDEDHNSPQSVVIKFC